jgi:hypothetical protein
MGTQDEDEKDEIGRTRSARASAVSKEDLHDGRVLHHRDNLQPASLPSGRLRQQGFDERAGLDAGPLPRADGPGHPPVRLARL